MINPDTLETAGHVFPPRNEWDIVGYDNEEIVCGYLDSEPDEPAPGGNRSPGYRWGWMNRARDRQVADDGFDAIRHAYIRLRRSAH